MHATGFRNSFTPLPGYFSPFPHGTHPLSVTKEYLGLTGGPARFTRNSTSPTLLGATPHQCHAYSYRTLTHSGTPSQTLHLHATFLTGQSCGSRTTRPPQPRTCNTCRLEHTHGLASSAFARHYSRNHTCFLFLRVLRCFTSPRYHPHPYTFRQGHRTLLRTFQVSPFGHPRITARSPTPQAYRRSQRPSSALGAKASTDRTTQLCTTPRRTNTYNNKDTRIHYTVLNHHTNTTHAHTQHSTAQATTHVIPHNPTACPQPHPSQAGRQHSTHKNSLERR